MGNGGTETDGIIVTDDGTILIISKEIATQFSLEFCQGKEKKHYR